MKFLIFTEHRFQSLDFILSFFSIFHQKKKKKKVKYLGSGLISGSVELANATIDCIWPYSPLKYFKKIKDLCNFHTLPKLCLNNS